MNLIEQAEKADAVAAGDPAAMSPDLRSLVNEYVRRRDDDDPKAAPFARAIVRRAEKEGLTAPPERSAADLKAEIKARNEGREDDAKIKPDGQSKAAMQAALDADDAAGGGA